MLGIRRVCDVKVSLSREKRGKKERETVCDEVVVKGVKTTQSDNMSWTAGE